jgi:hypothetical protein
MKKIESGRASTGLLVGDIVWRQVAGMTVGSSWIWVLGLLMGREPWRKENKLI